MHVEHRVGQAADDVRGDDVAGHAHDEQVAESLIEQQLRGHARIAAPQNGGKGMLPGRQFVPPPLTLMPLADVGGDKPLIARLEAGQRFLGAVRHIFILILTAG